MQTPFYKVFLFSLILSSILCCKTKTSHKGALEFYTTVMTKIHKMHEATESFMISDMRFSTQMLNNLKDFSSNDSLENIELFVSRRHLFDSLNIALAQIITDLESVKEIDEQISIKSKAIAYATQTREFWQTNFQNSLETFSDSKPDSDPEIDKLSLDLATQDLDRSRSILLRSAQNFETKYKITQEELKKYGL